MPWNIWHLLGWRSTIFGFPGHFPLISLLPAMVPNPPGDQNGHVTQIWAITVLFEMGVWSKQSLDPYRFELGLELVFEKLQNSRYEVQRPFLMCDHIRALSWDLYANSGGETFSSASFGMLGPYEFGAVCGHFPNLERSLIFCFVFRIKLETKRKNP